MPNRYLILLIIVALLNGALFNRIGTRVAERSYITVLLSLVLNNAGIHHHFKQSIRIAKRNLPSQNQSSNSLLTEQINSDNTCSSLYMAALVSKNAFPCPYEEDLTEAHKPPIFKPPS